MSGGGEDLLFDRAVGGGGLGGEIGGEFDGLAAHLIFGGEGVEESGGVAFGGEDGISGQEGAARERNAGGVGQEKEDGFGQADADVHFGERESVVALGHDAEVEAEGEERAAGVGLSIQGRDGGLGEEMDAIHQAAEQLEKFVDLSTVVAEDLGDVEAGGKEAGTVAREDEGLDGGIGGGLLNVTEHLGEHWMMERIRFAALHGENRDVAGQVVADVFHRYRHDTLAYSVTDDVIAVRPGEELDLHSLEGYLGEGPVELKQFGGGHSNLTYLLKTSANEYVLRRAPLGPVPPKAHDMAREFSVLRALHPVFPQAPRVYRLCEDPAVIGATFYLMERRRGRVFRDPAEIAAEGAEISAAIVDTLIELHAVDIEASGLIVLGKPEGFLERQVQGWSERWRRAQTEVVPDADRVIAWLGERRPPALPATLVHNDYKLDNLMFAAGEARVEAVLDWEMTTVGDPLADLGLSLCYWQLGGAHSIAGGAAPGGPAGWFTRDQFVERYAARTGRDLTHLRWHEVLGVFKLAVILQQIYYRYAQGQTRDPRFARFDERVRGLIAQAATLVEGATA